VLRSSVTKIKNLLLWLARWMQLRRRSPCSQSSEDGHSDAGSHADAGADGNLRYRWSRARRRDDDCRWHYFISERIADHRAISTPVPTPTPTGRLDEHADAGPAASMNFTAKNGSVIIDSSETRILVHAPSDAMDQLKLALKKFTNQAPSAQVYRTYEVHYAVPDPIPHRPELRRMAPSVWCRATRSAIHPCKN